MVGDPHPLDRERTSPNFLLRRLFGRRSREYDRQFFYPSLERGSLKDRGLVYLDCMYPRVIEGAPFPAVDRVVSGAHQSSKVLSRRYALGHQNQNSAIWICDVECRVNPSARGCFVDTGTVDPDPRESLRRCVPPIEA
jgi:hypothetical protein